MSTKSKRPVKTGTRNRVKKTIKEFKALLPKDYSERAQKEFSVSRQTVSKYLNRFDTSHPIMGFLTKLAEEEKTNKKAIESKIETLINE